MSQPPKRPAAVFDFDGTLTRSDSLLPFMLRLLRRHPEATRALGPALRRLPAYLAGRAPKEAMKALLLRAFVRLPEAEREALVRDFHQGYLAPRYLQGGLERVAWHRRQGHRLVLASASVELYLRPVAAALGFDHLLATRMELGPEPRPLGRNCYEREKVNRLMAEPWFDDVDWPASWGYSDHISDLPMLFLCGHPVAANPRPDLRRFARSSGWDIADWKEEVSPMSPKKSPSDSDTLEMPTQLLKALAYDPAASAAFDNLSDEGQRACIDLVNAARSGPEREERTAQAIQKLLKGEPF
jgi:HAD superfamily hydrolase (TIGR01490 family)